MSNPFFEAFQRPQNQQNQADNIISEFNNCKNNPIEFLANRGINVPQEYANNPEQTARYLLNNLPQVQQNKIFQTANLFKSFLGSR